MRMKAPSLNLHKLFFSLLSLSSETDEQPSFPPRNYGCSDLETNDGNLLKEDSKHERLRPKVSTSIVMT